MSRAPASRSSSPCGASEHPLSCSSSPCGGSEHPLSCSSSRRKLIRADKVGPASACRPAEHPPPRLRSAMRTPTGGGLLLIIVLQRPRRGWVAAHHRVASSYPPTNSALQWLAGPRSAPKQPPQCDANTHGGSAGLGPPLRSFATFVSAGSRLVRRPRTRLPCRASPPTKRMCSCCLP